MLTYPLFEGRFINRWLITTARKDPVTFEPVTLSGNYDELLKTGLAFFDNPCKTEFVRKRRTGGPPAVQTGDIFPGAEAVWEGQAQPLHIHYPFNDTGVDLSWFWSTPAHVSAFAVTVLRSGTRQAIDCEVITCGGIALRLNGSDICRFEPFTRNIAGSTHFELPLLAGENRLEVWWDDLAERDTSFFFRVACNEGSDIEQCIPIGQRNGKLLRKVEQSMEGLAFVRNHFTSGEVTLRCENPYDNESFSIHFTGATEENAKTGLLFQRTTQFAPGKHRASLGKIDDFPLGFLRFKAETDVEGITISRIITMESHPIALYPSAAVEAAERKKQALAFLARYGEENANRAIAMLYAGGPADAIEKLLYKQLDFINARNDCSDFYLILFPHVMRVFKDDPRLSPELKQAIKNCILNFRYWIDEPGNDVMWFFSENHALLFHICQLLCGELYPDEVFTTSGLSGREMQKKAEARLERWFNIFFAEGFTEWNSPAYLPIDSLGFACLYDGTANAELKEQARRGLDFIYYLMAIFGLDGCLASTAGRTYLKELMGNYSNCTSFMSYIGYGSGNMGHAGKGSLPLCFSDYEPPAGYAAWQRPAPGQALRCQSTQGQRGFAKLYCYKTSGFVLASACDFRPREPGHQENPIQLTFTPVAQLWINHPGEVAIYGTGRPSYWAGNGILPRVNQYRGFASVVFDISEDHPVGFTHLYFPTMEFHICRHQDHWLFGEEGDHYCAVYAVAGLEAQKSGPNTDREFISPGRRNIWFVRAASPSEFGSFDAFVSSMKSIPLETDLQKLSFRLEDPAYGKLSGGIDSVLAVNGETVQYSGYTREGEITIETLSRL
ncbi:hypothetical protein AGMMS50293_20300 [Spirochaetia bacterium]|nr:hypothetical protein AGMMS50293_20300 [Spirochaetia bacterium]